MISTVRWAKKQLSSGFPRSASAFRRLKREMHEMIGPRRTPLGFKFVGNTAMESGEFEREELQLVRKLLALNDVFVNVGANIGYYCCLALRSGMELIAFEPDERNLRTLYKNLAINDWRTGFEVYPIALSNTSGLVELFGENTGASLIQGWAGASRSSARYAPCTTLDKLLDTRLQGRKCLFLVDIEGSEFPMLQGASKQLHLQPKPTWMVEISTCEHQPQGTKVNPNLLRTFEMFWAANYQAFTADSRMRPISRQEVINAVSSQEELLGTHNFLFVASST